MMCESFPKRACSLLRNKDVRMRTEMLYSIKSKMPQTVRQFQRCYKKKNYASENQWNMVVIQKVNKNRS